MLERLIIENLALIDRLEIDLGSGFTVLTGETGAGKSIIIDGINLVLGSRGSREMISYGKQKCRVEAFFDVSGQDGAADVLKEMGLYSAPGELVIMREISVNGKSVCRVNGEIIPLTSLKRISDLIVDVQGQHEHQSLLDEKNHLGVIDRFSEETILPLIERTNSIFKEYSETENKLNSGFLSEAERERRIDILKYQINEIVSANLKETEESEISEQLRLLSNSEKIVENMNSASSSLNSEKGAVSLLKNASDRLSAISGFSSKYDEIASRLSDLYYELEDAAYYLRDMTLDLDFDPRRIDELETRLDVIESLKHKYGKTTAEVIRFGEDAKAELLALTSGAEDREKLKVKLAGLLEQYRRSAAELTAARKESARRLCTLSEEQLKSLGMKKARLSAEFHTIDDDPHENGSDTVSLLLSANEGEPLRPLSKIASGGELSRIMLALKTVITDADGIPTLIFDEVDTGISGSTANTVGLRMKHISKKHQVLCVTHLPQIAAFADTHFVVSKHECGGKTLTSVRKLEEGETASELARIMGAESTSEAAVSHARELIDNAKSMEL